MTTLLITICVLLWLACPVLCYGWTFAYFWHEYPTLQGQERKIEVRGYAASMCMIAIFGGPLAVLCLLAIGGTKHGLRFR